MKKAVFNFIFIISISIGSYSQNENNLTTNDKIFGLSLLWKEVSYNYAFFHQVLDLNWDSCYLASIPKVIEIQNDWDYYQELQKFMSQFQDGHIRIFTSVQLRDK